jgi:SAM-dependent methyltransferase
VKRIDLLRVHYPEARFGGFSDVDGTVVFYLRVRALLRTTDVVLDVGCGRGAGADDPVPTRRRILRLREECSRVIGIDVDFGARHNALIDEFRLIENSCWPVGNETVDLCLADWVLEHVADPVLFHSELARVLKPGGYFCARTSNRLGYVALADRLIPACMRRRVLQLTSGNRTDQDFFPVLHRCNTVFSLRKLLLSNGFDCVVYGFEAEPSYLTFSPRAYALGAIWQKWSPALLRNALFVFAKKRGSNGDGLDNTQPATPVEGRT